MDIALKFKKAFAIVAVAALLATNASVAIARAFTDVPNDAWYAGYVQQLVDDGVIDAGDRFGPDDNLNRAMLAKMVITAVDGLSGYEAPATPTFDDVAPDAWYYDYVEAAVQLGIVNGYTDAAGNLTGKYGPGDTVNRAAATKILVNAFSVPTDLDPPSIFPDVKEGAWYYDYVVTAYNQSVLDGYANGRFGPADPVTRAQAAKLTITAQNPVERAVGEGEGEGEGEGVVPTGEGALELSLNDATPASSTVPQSASNVDLLNFDLTAADDNVNVTNIVLTRGGVGKVADWDALYLYDGSNRITTGRTLNADTNTATFAVKVTVEAGTTKTLRLVGDVAQAGVGASNQHYFYVASAADLTSDAKSTAGDFPVAGNTFTMGGAGTVVNNLTITPGSAISQPQIGQLNAEVSSFKVQAGSTNDIALHQISVTQNGSFSASKMENLKLLRGTDEVASVAAFDGDRATFVLATPYVIPKGQSKTFYIHADINGGRTTDTVQIYLDENTDLVAIDQQYGYGAIIINSAVNGFKPGAALPLVVPTFLKGGTVTVADNGPAARQIAQNTTNVELLNYSVTAGRDLTVKDMDVKISLSTAGNAGTQPNVALLGVDTVDVTPGTTKVVCYVTAGGAGDVAGFAVNDMVSMPTATGTVYAIITGLAGAGCAGTGTPFTTNVPVANAVPLVVGGAVTEINPYTLVKNVKIVDMDSGSTLQGPMTKASDGTATADPVSYTKKFSEDYELVGGETRHLSVKVDVDQTLAAGYKMIATINYTTLVGYIKDMAANENVAAGDIVGGVLGGKAMTTASNSLVAAKASTPTTQTYVKGQDNVGSLGVSFTAGDAGDITIKKLNLRVYGNSALGPAPFAWAALRGDNSPKDFVSSVTLYNGNDVVDGPRTLTLVDANANGVWNAGEYYKVLFDNLSLKVAKGSTVTYTAKAKLLNGFTGPKYIALDMDPGNDITAEDADANTITAGGGAGSTVGGFNCINDTTAVAAAGRVVIEAINSGTLSASSEGNPESQNVLAGSTMKLVSKYKFTALREAYTVNKLTVMNDTDGGVFGNIAPGDTNALGQITVKYPDINGVSQTKTGQLAGGSSTLSDLGFYVAPGSAGAVIEIYSDISPVSIGEAISGKAFRLGIRDTANTESTFDATGVASSTTLNAMAGSPVPFSNPGSVNPMVVRSVVPVLAKASVTNVGLGTGENLLYSLTISADGTGGAVSLGRLSFTVTNNMAAPNLVAPFKLTRGTSPTLTVIDGGLAVGYANIHLGTTNADISTAGVVLAPAASADVVVSFFKEEVITAGSSITYNLYGTVGAGALVSGDSVQTKISAADEGVPVAGILATSVCGGGAQLCSTGNGNTGLIFDNVAAGRSLFTVNTDFFNKTVAGRAIIWSDNSADNSSYPTITAGAPNTVDVEAPATPFGYDWTNGYLLKAPTTPYTVSK